MAGQPLGLNQGHRLFENNSTWSALSLGITKHDLGLVRTGVVVVPLFEVGQTSNSLLLGLSRDRS